MGETQESLGLVKFDTALHSFSLYSKRRNLLADYGFVATAPTVSFRKQTMDSSRGVSHGLLSTGSRKLYRALNRRRNNSPQQYTMPC